MVDETKPVQTPAEQRAVAEQQAVAAQAATDPKSTRPAADNLAKPSPVTENPGNAEPAINRPDLPESVAAQHEQTDRARDELNAHNEEGNARNLEQAEKLAAATQDNKAHIPTGKEDNRNTPVVLKDGTKVWR